MAAQGKAPAAQPAKSAKKKFSAAGRAALSAAAKARWARFKEQRRATPTERKMSAAAKAKLSAAMKAKWATRKAAASG